jgi:Tripartite tricarboxylate transporter family receptor
VRAPPDGYTLLLVSTTNAINATLYERLNFNFIHGIAPVAGIIRRYMVSDLDWAVQMAAIVRLPLGDAGLNSP